MGCEGAARDSACGIRRTCPAPTQHHSSRFPEGSALATRSVPAARTPAQPRRGPGAGAAPRSRAPAPRRRPTQPAMPRPRCAHARRHQPAHRCRCACAADGEGGAGARCAASNLRRSRSPSWALRRRLFPLPPAAHTRRAARLPGARQPRPWPCPWTALRIRSRRLALARVRPYITPALGAREPRPPRAGAPASGVGGGTGGVPLDRARGCVAVARPLVLQARALPAFALPCVPRPAWKQTWTFVGR